MIEIDREVVVMSGIVRVRTITVERRGVSSRNVIAFLINSRMPGDISGLPTVSPGNLSSEGQMENCLFLNFARYEVIGHNISVESSVFPISLWRHVFVYHV